jgi:hypothetical protein
LAGHPCCTIGILLTRFGAVPVAADFACATLAVAGATRIGADIAVGGTELLSRKDFACGATWTTTSSITGLQTTEDTTNIGTASTLAVCIAFAAFAGGGERRQVFGSTRTVGAGPAGAALAV